MPHSLRKDGTVSKGSIYLWTAGFFPGSLWYVSEYLDNKPLQDSALVYTKKMEPMKTFTDNHDIGFMMYCSYGNANRFEPKPEYKDILVESARSLCTRFRPKAGVIQSWNGFRSWHGDKVYDFPVIIDNMMNLELLFYASKVTGDDSFRKVAISHAENTMKIRYVMIIAVSILYIMTKKQENRLKGKLLRDILTTQPGQEDRHGVSTGLRCAIVKQKTRVS